MNRTSSWLKKQIALLVLVLVSLGNFAPCLAKEAKSQKFNVFAVVSEKIEEQAKTVSAMLLEQTRIKTFPQLGFQIHCTLYMTNFPVPSQESVQRRVQGLAQAVRVFPIVSGGVVKTDGNWLFIDLEKNRNLQRLSDEVVNLLAGLRTADSEIPAWAKSIPEKVEMIKKYGSPNVYSQFNPHLTLLARTDGAILDGFLSRNAGVPAVKDRVQGEVVAIGYGVADGNGQMDKPIAIFPLKPQK